MIDHTAGLYLMDPKVRFFGFIPYQEKTDAAVAKLRKLMAHGRVFVAEAAPAAAFSLRRLRHGWQRTRKSSFALL